MREDRDLRLVGYPLSKGLHLKLEDSLHFH